MIVLGQDRISWESFLQISLKTKRQPEPYGFIPVDTHPMLFLAHYAHQKIKLFSPKGECIHGTPMINQPLKGLTIDFWWFSMKGSSHSAWQIFTLVIGDYTMTTVALPKVSLDSTFKLGRKSYTMASAIAHVVACYDKLHLLQEESLDMYREIGNFIIQTKGLFGNNKVAYGQFIATTDFNNEVVSQPDKVDSEFIATHWGKIQTLNKSGRLSSLSPSRIRQLLQEAYPDLKKKPKASKGAGNVSKGKKGAKGSEASEEATVAPLEPMNEAELAKQVFDKLEKLGFKRSEFAKELAKLYK